MRQFRIVTVVWGRSFTETFLTVCLPSLLSPNNLPHLARRTLSRYHIYTTAEDADVIQKSWAYRELSSVMPVEIAEIAGFSYVGKYKAMSQSHAHFIKSHRNFDCTFVFLIPDAVWADGGFARLLEISKTGKRIATIFTPRTAKETFIPELLKQYGRNGILRPVTRRELVRVAMDHLHPEIRAMTWNADPGPGVCYAGMYWRAKQGLLTRQFHLVPVMVRPLDKEAVPLISFDSDYAFKACPNLSDIYITRDSDDICSVDITSKSDTNSINVGRQSIEGAVAWVKANTDPLHRQFIKNKIRFHWDDCSEEWLPVEEDSDRTVESILKLFESSAQISDQPALSRTRYASPFFLLRKLKERGLGGFGRKALSRIVHPLMRKAFGPDLRIKMRTHSGAGSFEQK